MKSIQAKLKSQCGESLAEVLIALLISVLALTLLASMISSATDLIMSSRSTLEDYYNDIGAGADDTSRTATVVAGTVPYSFTISVHESSLGNKSVYSYVTVNGG